MERFAVLVFVSVVFTLGVVGLYYVLKLFFPVHEAMFIAGVFAFMFVSFDTAKQP